MATVEARLAALREFLKARSCVGSVFLVEDGAEYHTQEDPLDYLREHGAYTPDGRRIVLYPHPVEGVDPLSLSLYQLLDQAIETGRLDWPEELESDPA